MKCSSTIAIWIILLDCFVSHWSCPAQSPSREQHAPTHSNTSKSILQWELGPTGTKASLRGLHAVNDTIVWASGSSSTVIRSVDAGSSWTDCSPIGFDEVEFRCVHAWSDEVACVASAGSPAVILRTVDGGESWVEAYRAISPDAFFDAMKFWDTQRGCAISDPVDGRLLVIETEDGGRSWSELPRDKLPPSLDGEAAFAASNSSLCLGPNGRLWFGTGGSVSAMSRLYQRSTWTEAYTHSSVPMPSGPSMGIFSIALGLQANAGEAKELVIVGGDYRPDAVSKVVACISQDGGLTWQTVASPPRAYRSAVVALPAGVTVAARYVAAGPTGTDFSADGDIWHPISLQGFHALSVGGTTIFACGADGRFAVARVTE